MHPYLSAIQPLWAHVPLIFSIFVCALVSACANGIVARLHKRQLRAAAPKVPEMTLEQYEAQYGDILNRFDMKVAADIGKIERVLYIIAVANGWMPIISGWLTLKAFSGWITGEDVAQKHRMQHWHLYLYGNALSLLLGLSCGGLAIVMNSELSVVWPVLR